MKRRPVMKENKWFEKDPEEPWVFKSKTKAVTLEEGFEKILLKWELIIKGFKPITAVESCGLCNLFFFDFCKECPIYKKTGWRYCQNTPYTEWIESGNQPLWAGKEYDFLKGLAKELGFL